MDDNRTPVLSGEKLNKTYKSHGRAVQPLKDVSFSLYQGEVLGVVGESGSGKSTLLKMVSCLEKPDSGSLYYMGKEYTGSKPSEAGRFLQMIFQDAYGSFDPRMKMEASLNESSHSGRQEMLRIVGEVGLSEELLSRRPRNLSGGQCQRMSIARALLSKARVLLCDEITSALDVTTQAQVIRLLLELRQLEDVSMIFVSHDLALVSAICDRVMVMQNGVCVEEGETKRIIDSPSHPYTKALLESVISVV